MSDAAKKYVFYGLVLMVAVVLVFRLVQLQLMNQSEYGKESMSNSTKTVTIIPPRGLMYDRNGKVVVDNRPSYSVMITPSQFDTNQIQEIAGLIQMEPAEIREILKGVRGTNRFNPTRIKRDVDFPVISYLSENEDRLIGVDYQVEALRYYPNDFRGSHIFGYTKEISEKQLKNQVGNYYKQGDIIGIKGLEKEYETYLRGEKGYEFIAVDVKGREMGSVNDGKDNIAPINGSDLMLSIDSELQAYAEKLMKNYKGAIIAMDPRTGEILCMVSKPDFDLSIFSGPTDKAVLNALMTDEGKPLFNRATMTNYPPGSTWKMMMGLAGMGSGTITPTSTIVCGGSFTFGTKTFMDHGAYGPINVVTAIEHSSNVFFYKLALQIGLDNYHKFGTMLGFGKKTGIDIPEELPGRLPSVEYYNKVYGEGKWTQGYIVSLGIGQGELGVTPIQMAAYTSAIAMDGLYWQPHFVKKVVNPNTQQEETPQFQSRQIDIPKKYFEVVKKGMYLVVNGNGTATNIKNQDFKLAGKTGTAQNSGGPNHSWFVGFAPYDDPRIAVCVLGEGAGWGNVFGAPAAGAIMVRFLSGNSLDIFNPDSNIKSVGD
ncbi:MAG: penicillin-binding protein 2 [Ignavibacteriae bacterium]|nr:penicillin-binding protein 2 [Ignavibacteriota bacterium]MCB9243006.1 penicillin-binding protein 2 [Ignavibacteriales bacterium]